MLINVKCIEQVLYVFIPVRLWQILFLTVQQPCVPSLPPCSGVLPLCNLIPRMLSHLPQREARMF